MDVFYIHVQHISYINYCLGAHIIFLPLRFSPFFAKERRDASNVAKNKKAEILNTVNRDLGSEDMNDTVDTRGILLRVKPDLLSRLKSVTAGAS